MNECTGDCLTCGKCAKRSFAILDSFETAAAGGTGYGIAADIGTTSVVLALIALDTGTVAARHSFMNPQRTWGADVISRIKAAAEGHLDALTKVIRGGLSRGVTTLLEANSVPPEQVARISVAGNTVMTYLLLGYPCESLGAFPFKPAFAPRTRIPYGELFSEPNIRCEVNLAPWLAAFVGGDITAGLLYASRRKLSRYLLMDLGTNGEIALADGDRLLVTSTAAGPAFEGSGRPGGASAVLSDLAGLLRDGWVDETGLLEDGAPELFTQEQIRDLQLAKAAVRSGFEILLEEAGLKAEELDAVFLAGGIGQAIDPDCAMEVGMLPGLPKEKLIPIGNASLGGAALTLFDEFENAASLLEARAEELNLSAHPRFNDTFVEYIVF